jgi:hypothetical protein
MQKEWISADDARTRDSDDSANHRTMNGVRIDLDEKFLVPSRDGVDEMDGPGDQSAPADQVVQCRCILTYRSPQKTFNLRSDAAKRRFWLRTMRQRDRFERRFASQVASVFRKQLDEVKNAVDGLEDLRLVEMAAMQSLNDTNQDLETVLRSNYENILSKFGEDVFKEIDQ